MSTKAWASLLVGCGLLTSGCLGAGRSGRGAGTDPALRSNAAVTPGGSELGGNGSANDLRPGERAPTSRLPMSNRGFAVDVSAPRGPSFQGPSESGPAAAPATGSASSSRTKLEPGPRAPAEVTPPGPGPTR